MALWVAVEVEVVVVVAVVRRRPPPHFVVAVPVVPPWLIDLADYLVAPSLCFAMVVWMVALEVVVVAVGVVELVVVVEGIVAEVLASESLVVLWLTRFLQGEFHVIQSDWHNLPIHCTHALRTSYSLPFIQQHGGNRLEIPGGTERSTICWLD